MVDIWLTDCCRWSQKLHCANKPLLITPQIWPTETTVELSFNNLNLWKSLYNLDTLGRFRNNSYSHEEKYIIREKHNEVNGVHI